MALRYIRTSHGVKVRSSLTPAGWEPMLELQCRSQWRSWYQRGASISRRANRRFSPWWPQVSPTRRLLERSGSPTRRFALISTEFFGTRGCATEPKPSPCGWARWAWVDEFADVGFNDFHISSAPSTIRAAVIPDSRRLIFNVNGLIT